MGAKNPWLWLTRANWDRCDTLNLSLIITYFFFFLSIRPVFTLGYMSKWLLWKSACFGPMSSVNLNNVTVRLGTDGKAYRKISYQVKRRRSRNQEVLAVVPLIRAAVAVLLKWPHGHTHTCKHTVLCLHSLALKKQKDGCIRVGTEISLCDSSLRVFHNGNF